MLAIRNGGISDTHIPTTCWWVGYGRPRNLGRVVTFQADGHELEAILLGLACAYVGDGGETHLLSETEENV